jgi:hypothetical protein
MKNKLFTISYYCLAIILIQSCSSTARLSDFPKTAKEYNFDKIANSKKTQEDKSWNKKAGYEYYLQTNSKDDSLIIQAIIGALRSEGFLISFIHDKDGAIVGERGLQANEWKSVAGVYYQKNDEGFEVYVRCKITQDITGGWREDRAKKIGEKICVLLKNCFQSYPVNTAMSQ